MGCAPPNPCPKGLLRSLAARCMPGSLVLNGATILCVRVRACMRACVWVQVCVAARDDSTACFGQGPERATKQVRGGLGRQGMPGIGKGYRRCIERALTDDAPASSGLPIIA